MGKASSTAADIGNRYTPGGIAFKAVTGRNALGQGGVLGGLFGGGGGGGGPMFDPGPRPDMPTFQSLRDPKTGLLSNDNYRLDPNAINTKGLEEIRSRALATGPSAWAQLANQKQGVEESAALDKASSAAAGAQANARAGLASRRGLSGGASERLATQGAKDSLFARQDVGRQGILNRATIGLQDEQAKTDLLKGLPGMETQLFDAQGKAKSYNIENALKDKYAQDSAKQMEYQEQMKSWAAQNQANAISAAGGGKK